MNIHPAFGDPSASGPVSPLHVTLSAVKNESGFASRLAADTQVTGGGALGNSLEPCRPCPRKWQPHLVRRAVTICKCENVSETPLTGVWGV